MSLSFNGLHWTSFSVFALQGIKGIKALSVYLLPFESLLVTEALSLSLRKLVDTYIVWNDFQRICSNALLRLLL